MRSASTKAKTRAGRKDAAIKKRAVTTARGLVKNAPKAPADSDEDIRTLKRELVEAHQRERATADVLKVISRSTFDLQTVLDALVESAAKLCEAEAAAIARQIGSVYKPVATYGQAGDDKAFSARTTIQPTRGSALGRAVIDGRAVHIADVLDDPVQFGGKADHSHIGQDGAIVYANKRAEMWGAMRAWLAGGMIPDDRELMADLTGVEYGYVLREGRDAIILEKKEDMKKRGLASPDLADALALTFAYPVAATDHRWQLTGNLRHQYQYDPFQQAWAGRL